MARFTNSEIKAHKAKQTIRFYLAGGSRPVLISRGFFRGSSRASFVLKAAELLKLQVQLSKLIIWASLVR